MKYEEFLASKAVIHGAAGIDPREPHEMLFPFQRDIVKWALRRAANLDRAESESDRDLFSASNSKSLALA